MSSAGKTLTLLLHEWSNQMEIAFPTIMHIDTKDGSIKSSYSLEYNKHFESLQGIWGLENIETYGAILTDDQDPWSSSNHFTYVSFVRDGSLEFVRLATNKDNSRPNIDYFYQFQGSTVKPQVERHLQKNVPQRIIEDVSDRRFMYLAGRYGGAASVFKLNKRDFEVSWYAQFNSMSNINAIESVQHCDSDC